MKKLKPTHYKVICISLYTDDLQRLDAMVEELKNAGAYKANRSQLIRLALDQARQHDGGLLCWFKHCTGEALGR